MADRKQGAGLSSGSSAAVHKANSPILQKTTTCHSNHPVLYSHVSLAKFRSHSEAK